MSGNDERILLDLNYPDFQDELFALDSSEFKKVGKTLLKLKRMTWNELFRDKGLHWEELKSVPGKFSSNRLTQ
jgi:hypothetical protein